MLSAAARRKIGCRHVVGQTVATPLYMGSDWRGVSRPAENKIG
jgi:hypothetical protein